MLSGDALRMLAMSDRAMSDQTHAPMAYALFFMPCLYVVLIFLCDVMIERTREETPRATSAPGRRHSRIYTTHNQYFPPKGIYK